MNVTINKDTQRKTDYNNIKRKFLFHKKTFQIKDDFFLNTFEELIDYSNPLFLECSCKYDEEKTYPARFNLFYNKRRENHQNLIKIIEFLNKLSRQPQINFDYTTLTSIFTKSFNLNNIHKLILGIDVRSNIQQSKVRLYFFIRDCPQKIKEIISIYGKDKKILKYYDKNHLPFCIELQSNRKSKIKVYPLLKNKNQENKKVMKEIKSHLPKNAISFLNHFQDSLTQIGLHHTSFNKKDPEKILYFKNNKKNKVINEINSPKLKKIHELFKESFNWKYLGIPEKELEKKEISRFNFYY